MASDDRKASLPLTLDDIDASAWGELANATDDPQSGFRYLTLCSVDAESKPQARMVVLRDVDKSTRTLTFHTDIRSPKWLELSGNPHMTILGFCGQTRLQLRLQGIARIYSPDSAVANHAWQALPSWTRQTYTGGPPGDEHADATLAETDALQGTHDTKGKMHFGVIHFKTRTLDWFQLRRQHNLRARLSYDASGILVDVRWVNP